MIGKLLCALLGVLTVGVSMLGAMKLADGAGFRLKKIAKSSDETELEVDEKSGFLSARAIITLILGSVVFAVSTVIGERALVLIISDAVLVVFMGLLSLIDIAEHRVPNKLLLIMLILWLAIDAVTIILDTAYGLELLFRALAGALVAGLIFLLCYLLTSRQLGGGDVKLAAILGLYMTGQRVMGVILYGMLCCCAYSLIQLARKRLGLKDGVPLVPFLFLGVLVTLILAA